MEGGKWLYGLLGVLGSTLLLVALFGVTLSVALTRGPSWILWAVPLAVFVMAFVEGAYRVHRADEDADRSDHTVVTVAKEGVTASASVPTGHGVDLSIHSEGVRVEPYRVIGGRESANRAVRGAPPLANPDDEGN